MLRSELERVEPELVSRLHRRAASWFERDGLPEAAIEHAAAGGDLDTLARLVGTFSMRYFRSGRVATVERWLRWFDETDLLAHYPAVAAFGASVFVTRKGGVITTCASTSGYMHEYDNRYLWMSLKRIISSHFANYRESWEANRLVAKGMIHPTLSRTYPLHDVGQAALDVHQNAHQGKVGVLCLAPKEGLGVRNQELREKHETAINRFRGV